MHDDLWKLDAVAQAALVRSRQITPLELLDAAISRIERLNPQINAVITPLYDRARVQASRADLDAPFAGVPMLLKDACQQIEGTPYYIGTSVLRDIGYRSTRTTELTERFERAGFLALGKTNVPELSSGATTEPRAFGATHNPWDLTRTPGGSSGGSAAAVASGMVSVASGGDAGGSLRYPAACCGLVTLKPSRGRVPTETPTGDEDVLGMWSEFVLARSVRDLAAILDAVGGAGRDEAIVAPSTGRAYADELAVAPEPLRIGLLKRDVSSGMPVDQECVEAVERTGRLLESLGHHVEEAHPAGLDDLYARTWAGWTALITMARYTGQRALAQMAGRELTQDDLEQPIVSREEADAVSSVQFAGAVSSMLGEARGLRSWWRDAHDVLVTPTTRQPAWPLGQIGGAADAGTFPFAWSLTGQPAMSLPLHWTASGLPVGVQVVAAYGREDVLFRVASQLEAAAPWADRWPTIALGHA